MSGLCLQLCHPCLFHWTIKQPLWEERNQSLTHLLSYKGSTAGLASIYKRLICKFYIKFTYFAHPPPLGAVGLGGWLYFLKLVNT